MSIKPLGHVWLPKSTKDNVKKNNFMTFGYWQEMVRKKILMKWRVKRFFNPLGLKKWGENLGKL